MSWTNLERYTTPLAKLGCANDMNSQMARGAVHEWIASRLKKISAMDDTISQLSAILNTSDSLRSETLIPNDLVESLRKVIAVNSAGTIFRADSQSERRMRAADELALSYGNRTMSVAESAGDNFVVTDADSFNDWLDYVEDSYIDQTELYTYMDGLVASDNEMDIQTQVVAGLNSDVDEIKQLATSISSNGLTSTLGNVIGAIQSACVDTTTLTEESGYVVDFADYSAKTTANLATGLWEVASSVISAVGTIAMVCGGIVVKTAGAIATGVISLVDMLKSKYNSMAHGTFGDGSNLCYANAIARDIELVGKPEWIDEARPVCVNTPWARILLGTPKVTGSSILDYQTNIPCLIYPYMSWTGAIRSNKLHGTLPWWSKTYSGDSGENETIVMYPVSDAQFTGYVDDLAEGNSMTTEAAINELATQFEYCEQYPSVCSSLAYLAQWFASRIYLEAMKIDMTPLNASSWGGVFNFNNYAQIVGTVNKNSWTTDDVVDKWAMNTHAWAENWSIEDYHPTDFTESWTNTMASYFERSFITRDTWSPTAGVSIPQRFAGFWYSAISWAVEFIAMHNPDDVPSAQYAWSLARQGFANVLRNLMVYEETGKPYIPTSGTETGPDRHYVIDPSVCVTDNVSVVANPFYSPPAWAPGTALIAFGIVLAATVVTLTVAAVCSKKIRNHQKLKARRKEAAAIAAAEEYDADPTNKAKAKQYLKSQKRFQRYADRVGYSSNSVGSYAGGGTLDNIRESYTPSTGSEVSLESIWTIIAGTP